MACPTCDHTMQSTYGNIFWCPRCGTLKDANEVQKPKLVTRVAEFVETLDDDEPDDRMNAVILRRLGVIESIAIPGDRR